MCPPGFSSGLLHKQFTISAQGLFEGTCAHGIRQGRSKYGKHSAKIKLKTVPPESYLSYCATLGGHFWHPKSGTDNNSPAVQLLTFILLVAATKMPFSQNSGTVNNSLIRRGKVP